MYLPLSPILSLALSLFTFHLALHNPSHLQRLLLLPIYLSSGIFSMRTSSQFLFLPWITSMWSQALILNLLHGVNVLYIRRWPAPQSSLFAGKSTLGRVAKSWVYTWRVWSNPQMVNVPPPTTTPQQDQKLIQGLSTRAYATTLSTRTFLLHRLAPLPIYFLIQTHLSPLLTSSLFKTPLHPTSFSSAKSSLFPFQPSLLNRWDMSIRVYHSLHWILQSYICLSSTHALLSAVTILVGLDAPSDWPPLFGEWRKITSLRRFWGVFWHGVGRGTYVSVAAWMADLIGLRAGGTESRRNDGKVSSPGGRKQSATVGGKATSESGGERAHKKTKRNGARKLLIPLLTFLLSGLSHSLTSLIINRPYLPDISFFLLNFLACAIETAFLKSILPALSKHHGLRWLTEQWVGGPAESKAETSMVRGKARPRLAAGKAGQWVVREQAGKWFGRLWVFLFLYITVPKWQYPSLYKEAVYERQMAAWGVLFDKLGK